MILNITTRTRRKQVKTKSQSAILEDFINTQKGALEDDDNNQKLISFRKSICTDIVDGLMIPSTLYNAIQKAAQQLRHPSQNQEPRWSEQHSKALDQLIARREKAKQSKNKRGYWLCKKSIKCLRQLENQRLWDKAIDIINADKNMTKETWKLIQSLRLIPDTLPPLKIPRVMDPTTGEMLSRMTEMVRS